MAFRSAHIDFGRADQQKKVVRWSGPMPLVGGQQAGNLLREWDKSGASHIGRPLCCGPRISRREEVGCVLSVGRR